jgi:hypothetical protein
MQIISTPSMSGAVYRVGSMPRLCENSIFQKCTSTESIAYDSKNAKIRVFPQSVPWLDLDAPFRTGTTPAPPTPCHRVLHPSRTLPSP